MVKKNSTHSPPSLDSVTTINSKVASVDASDDLYLTLSYATKSHLLSLAQLPFNIGRDPSVNHLVIDSHLVSRQHAQIALESDRLVYRDLSRNGSFIQEGTDEPIYVRNETYLLHGAGLIKLGDFMHLGDENLITYQISINPLMQVSTSIQ